MANIKRANTSGITKSGAAISDVPDAPTIGAVTDTANGGTVTVAYTAATTGGAVTTFTATSTPGSLTGTGASPITVTGLTDGTAYTFKVKGANSTATGPESAASSSVTPTNFLVGSYDSIATVTVGAGGSDTITFSSIPATYTHLQVRAIFKNTYLTYGGAQNFTWRCNGDTAGNYASQSMHGYGETAQAGQTVISEINATYMNFPYLNISDNVANTRYAVCIMDVLDYRNTNKFKTFRNVGGVEQIGTSGFSSSAVFQSGLWRSTSAITSIVITGYGNFKQYSQFALYGIKGD